MNIFTMLAPLSFGGVGEVVKAKANALKQNNWDEKLILTIAYSIFILYNPINLHNLFEYLTKINL